MFVERTEDPAWFRQMWAFLSEGFCGECRNPVGVQRVNITAGTTGAAHAELLVCETCDTEWWPNHLLDPDVEGWSRHQRTVSVLAGRADRREPGQP